MSTRLSKPNKANPSVAMSQLIAEVRVAVPFDTPVSELCDGPCTGCSKKLLDFLDQELEEWETRLDRGDSPTFGDLQRLGKQSQKIFRVLQKNGLIKA